MGTGVADLSQRCGEHLTYGDLITCSDTWKRLDRAAGGHQKVRVSAVAFG